MYLRELLVRNILGSLGTMNQEKFEFIGLLSFVLLKIPAIHEKFSLKVYSGLVKLKLQYFSHLMRRVDSLEKTLMLGGIEGQEEKGTTEDEMAGWHH